MCDDGLLLLRNAIIERAVDDYKGGRHMRREVEAFLLSDFCAVLLTNSTTSGPKILTYLKQWEEENRWGPRGAKRRAASGDVKTSSNDKQRR